jgi:hypothetical protein
MRDRIIPTQHGITAIIICRGVSPSEMLRKRETPLRSIGNADTINWQNQTIFPFWWGIWLMFSSNTVIRYYHIIKVDN